MKKLFCLFLITTVLFSAWADVSLKVQDGGYMPLNTITDPSLEGTIGLELTPFADFARSGLILSLEGGAGSITGKGISPVYVVSGAAGAGLEIRPADRFSITLEGTAGLWSVPEALAGSFSPASGILFGGKVSAYYYLSPAVSVGLYGGYSNLYYKPEPLLTRIDAGLSLRYNFSQGIMGASRVETVGYSFDPVFPVFYSQYNEIPFGQVSFCNTERNTITDVDILLYIDKFMATPSVVTHYDSIGMNETFTTDITAFLNESILSQILPAPTAARILVRYTSLGKRMEFEESVQLETLGRNNMSWVEDERAAAFVSSRDAAASKFAGIVRILMKDQMDMTENVPEQYARALFAALKAYGINYVVDPASAFTDNAGSGSVDFLQFPYQTILYHGGDCDDLTILNCALLESLGVETAFVTVPGHIYMAYNSGYDPADISDPDSDEFIIQDGIVWAPVEITLCRDTYEQARFTAFAEWKQFAADRRLIPLRTAWARYKPVSIPESDIDFEMPSKENILQYY